MVTTTGTAEERALESPEAFVSPCTRCSGKGFVLCPDCRGAGGERDEFMVLITKCEGCQPSNKGYVSCPRCQGAGVARHRVTLPF